MLHYPHIFISYLIFRKVGKMNNVISREKFIDAINSLQKARDFEDKIFDLGTEYGVSVDVTHYDLAFAVINLLAYAMGNADHEIIDKFCFELNFGRNKGTVLKFKTNNGIDLSSPDKLYDYLLNLPEKKSEDE